MTTTRRTLLTGSAALALSALPHRAARGAHEAATTDAADTRAPRLTLVPPPPADRIGAMIGGLTTGNADLDAQIDALTPHVQEFCGGAWDEYKDALAALLGRDPRAFAFDHPATVCDEAAVGLGVTAWANGLRLGAAIADRRSKLASDS